MRKAIKRWVKTVAHPRALLAWFFSWAGNEARAERRRTFARHQLQLAEAFRRLNDTAEARRCEEHAAYLEEQAQHIESDPVPFELRWFALLFMVVSILLGAILCDGCGGDGVARAALEDLDAGAELDAEAFDAGEDLEAGAELDAEAFDSGEDLDAGAELDAEAFDAGEDLEAGAELGGPWTVDRVSADVGPLELCTDYAGNPRDPTAREQWTIGGGRVQGCALGELGITDAGELSHVLVMNGRRVSGALHLVGDELRGELRITGSSPTQGGGWRTCTTVQALRGVR